jgi:hypothetical protein
MDIFLRAKHWQLFLITFGLPFSLQIVMMASIFSSLINHHDPTLLFSHFKLFPIIMLLFLGTMFGWQWSVAMGLQKLIPEGLKMKTVKFKVFFIIPVIYITSIMILMGFIFGSNILNGGQPGPWIFGIFLFIVPVHLFAMFCIFYTLYFVAKTFKTVELQRAVTFSDFMGEFFLIWFFPIGIWIIQPRLNIILKEYTDRNQHS